MYTQDLTDVVKENTSDDTRKKGSREITVDDTPDIRGLIYTALTEPSVPDSGRIGDLTFEKENDLLAMYSLRNQAGDLVGAFFPESNTLILDDGACDKIETIAKESITAEPTR